MEYLLHVGVLVGIYAILAMSLDIVLGYTGIPSLGHSAFALIGAYTSSLLSVQVGLSPWVTLWIGAGASALVGSLAAYPAVRLKGDYLALATLGLAIVVEGVVRNWTGLTGGAMGVPGIPNFHLFGWEIVGPARNLAVVGAMALVCFGVLYLVVNRPFGRVLRAIRDDEKAAQSLGKNTARFKVEAFVVSAFFTGVGGALYAHYITFVSPSTFSLLDSLTILLMVILGGMGTLRGAALGAFVLIVLPESLRFLGLPMSIFAPLRQILYGATLVVLMMYRPSGLIGTYRWTQ